MFASRYFSPRYWASRFWPKIGGEPVDTTDAVILLNTTISNRQVQLNTVIEEIDVLLTTTMLDNVLLLTPISSASVQVRTKIEEINILLNTGIE